MKLRGWLILVCAGWRGVLAGAAGARRPMPEAAALARVTRETIHSGVPTNGQVEPIEWAVVRAERGGPVAKIMVSRGQAVAKDQPLVRIDSNEARAATWRRRSRGSKPRTPSWRTSNAAGA